MSAAAAAAALTRALDACHVRVAARARSTPRVTIPRAICASPRPPLHPFLVANPNPSLSDIQLSHANAGDEDRRLSEGTCLSGSGTREARAMHVANEAAGREGKGERKEGAEDVFPTADTLGSGRGHPG